VTLTNGGAKVTEALLERAGIAEHIERIIAVEEVHAWKPSAAPYLHAAHLCGVPPDRLALVAAHSWDIHGARRAGLVTGWVSRLEHSFPPTFAPADVTGDDLVQVVDRLLALPD